MSEAIDLEVADLLRGAGLTLAAAESCTGGLLSARIIDRPGSSAYFLEGAVTYSNEAKVSRLGVKEATLRRFGAVSPETAGEMAEGIARSSGADIGVSTTGIAGPEGGSPEKPVGLVYIGLSFRGELNVEACHFAGSRREIREQSVQRALELLRRALVSHGAPRV